MTATRHIGPARNVIAALDPFTRWKWGFLRKSGDGARHADKLATSKMHRRFPGFVIQAHRGMDGLGHPVQRYVAQQLILGEPALDIAVAIRPIAKLGNDPCS